METQKENNIELKHIIPRYTRYWPYFVVSVILAVMVGYYISQKTHPRYVASANFLLEEDKRTGTSILNLTGMASLGRGMGPSVVNESMVLKSRPLATQVLESLKFDVEYYSKGTFLNKEVYKKTPILVEVDWSRPQLTDGEILIRWENDKEFTVEFLEDEYRYLDPVKEIPSQIDQPLLKNNTFNFGEWIDLPFSKFKIDKTGSDYEGEMIVVFRDIQSLVSDYTGDNFAAIQLDPESSVIELSIITNHADKSKDYLARLMDQYLHNLLEEKNRAADKTVNFIDDQLSGVHSSLTAVETQMGQFRSANKTYNMSSEGNTIFSQISSLEQELSREKYKRSYFQNLREYLVREDYNEIVVPSGMGIEDPILNSLIQNLITLQAEKSRLMATLTEASPPVREVTRKLRDLNNSIREVLKNVENNSRMTVEDLQARIAKIENNFSRLPETEQGLIKMQREFAINEGIYNFLLQRRAEAAISRASNTIKSKIIDQPRSGDFPVSPKKKRIIIVSVLLGFLLPVGVITIKDFFNNKISEVKDFERELKLPLMAKIGINRKKTNLVVMKENREVVTEAFRSLRSNIAYAFPKDKQLTVLFTSTISGEGKTFCAMNLASAYSLSGKKTLLIGCDLRKPRIYSDFGLSNKMGLSTYLSEQVETVEEVIKTTEFPHLDILLSGPIPPNPSELMTTQRFVNLIQYLKTKYDVIVMDTPPVGLASETMDMFGLADVTFYLFRFNYSQKIFVEHANDLKVKHGLKNTYAILNGISEKEMEYGGYGLKYYAEEEKKPLLKRIFGGVKDRAAI